MLRRSAPLPLLASALALTAAGCGSDGATSHARPPLDPPLVTPGERAATRTAAGPRAEEARVVQLGTPAPARFPTGSPGRAAAAFLLAWHDRAWDRAADWTAPSWRHGAADRGAVLRRRYGPQRLRGWDVGLVRRTSAATARVAVRLASRRTGRATVERTRVTLRLVREDARGRPVLRGGRWGVLPAATIEGKTDATTR